jgi:hypothetical protein
MDGSYDMKNSQGKGKMNDIKEKCVPVVIAFSSTALSWIICKLYHDSGSGRFFSCNICKQALEGDTG